MRNDSMILKIRAWHKELEDMTYSSTIMANGIDKAFMHKVVTYPEMYEELMLFSNVADKFNKPIYQKDIIKYAFKFSDGRVEDKVQYGIVDFGEVRSVGGATMGFGIMSLEDHINEQVIYHRLLGWDIEVIGNLYETPELISEFV